MTYAIAILRRAQRELQRLPPEDAVRRDEEMESGSVVGIPAEQVFAELRSKGK
jgi:mRNA-degrading endonuclease RelE of RelBE toxin-antitoxin system